MIHNPWILLLLHVHLGLYLCKCSSKVLICNVAQEALRRHQNAMAPTSIAIITLCTGHSIFVRNYVNIAFYKIILMTAASYFALTMPQTSVLNVFHTLSHLIESSPECYETGVMMPVWLWENRGLKTNIPKGTEWISGRVWLWIWNWYQKIKTKTYKSHTYQLISTRNKLSFFFYRVIL